MSTICLYAEPMKQKPRLIYQLNVARHAMMKSLDSGCRRELGISVVQLSALLVLQEQQGCLMKELAQALMLDKSAVTGLTKRMEEGGLLYKYSDENDSRITRLRMTEQGKQALYQGLSLLKGVNHDISEGFSEQEIATVSRFLSHVTRLFST